MYTPVEFKAGAPIFSQGDEGRSMYLIQEGELEVLQELDGIEMQIAVLERGDFFGEMAILEAVPRSHSVRALSDAKLVEIDTTGFLKMLQRNPEIAVRMIRKLSRRLARTEEMLFDTYASTLSRPLTLGPEDPPPARNRYLLDPTSGRKYPLPQKREITVGRLDPANDILPDVDLTPIDVKLSTSRRHAKILVRDGSFFVIEEGATNGTFVNDDRVLTGQPLPVHAGDELRFGIVRLRFIEE